MDGLMLQLLAEAWPNAVALAVGLALTEGGQGFYLVFWHGLGNSSRPVEGISAVALVIALTTAFWAVPAMIGATLGTVLHRYGTARRHAPSTRT